MPHVSDGGGVDLSSNDEIKVFQVEGEGEDEERSSSENLKEVKNSLVAEVPDEEVGCVKSCAHVIFHLVCVDFYIMQMPLQECEG